MSPVELEGATHVPGQANKAYVFPGIGLGLIAGRARTVPDAAFARVAELMWYPAYGSARA